VAPFRGNSRCVWASQAPRGQGETHPLPGQSSTSLSAQMQEFGMGVETVLCGEGFLADLPSGEPLRQPVMAQVLALALALVPLPPQPARLAF